MPTARRPAARHRAGGRPDPRPQPGSDPGAPRRPLRAAHRGQPCRASASADAAGGVGLEPRPARPRRAAALREPQRVRRAVHARGRRGGVRRGRFPAGRLTLRPRCSRRQVAGREGRGRWRPLLPAARERAGVRTPVARRVGHAGPDRRTVRGALPRTLRPVRRRVAAPAARVDALGRARDGQHPRGAPPDPRWRARWAGCDGWARPRGLPGLVLGHAGDDGGRAVARRAPRPGVGAGRSPVGVLRPRVPRRAAGRPARGRARPCTRRP